MKVVLINGSSNEKGCTYTALSEMVKVFEEYGVETEILQMGSGPIRDCIGCGACGKLNNQCVFNDDVVNELSSKMVSADGVVFGSPVYYAHPSGRILSALDRVFTAASKSLAHKPGMVVASARRGGTTATFDVLNKYFTIAQMPVVSSTYWNMVHGSRAEQVLEDEEGLQIMRNGARNMIWMLQCIEAGKAVGIEPPVAERASQTNFIR